MSSLPTASPTAVAAALTAAAALRLCTMAAAKKQKLEGALTIGTHSGTFQCDEALGVWMLRQLPKWADAKLVRSRNNEVLDGITAAGGIVIDVGGRYDAAPDALRFDHHQRGFFETFDGEVGAAKGPEEATGNFKTKLSATGLVYKHFGRELLTTLCPALEGARLEAVYVKLYKGMIEGIDAIDNGIEIAETTRYREGTGLSARVARLNPRWNQPKVDQAGEDALFVRHPCPPPAPLSVPPGAGGCHGSRSSERRRRAQEKASAMTGQEFREQLASLTESWLPARDVVEASLLKRSATHPSSQILCFEGGGMPWQGHLYELERQHGVEVLIKFVVYPDNSGMWRVQARQSPAPRPPPEPRSCRGLKCSVCARRR